MGDGRRERRQAARRGGAALIGLGDVVLQPTDAATVPDVDVAFLALPHGAAAETGRTLAARGIRVVDFSADWRLQDAARVRPVVRLGASASRTSSATGCTAFRRRTGAELAGATKVANPGCYPTAAILALAPLLAAGGDRCRTGSSSRRRPASAARDARSPPTTSSRSWTRPSRRTASERTGTRRRSSRGCRARPAAPVLVTFTPHLAPMTRGLLDDVLRADDVRGRRDVRNALEVAYKGEPFVHVLADGVQPATKSVSGSNHALIGVAADERTGTAVDHVCDRQPRQGRGRTGRPEREPHARSGRDGRARRRRRCSRERHGRAGVARVRRAGRDEAVRRPRSRARVVGAPGDGRRRVHDEQGAVGARPAVRAARRVRRGARACSCRPASRTRSPGAAGVEDADADGDARGRRVRRRRRGDADVRDGDDRPPDPGRRRRAGDRARGEGAVRRGRRRRPRRRSARRTRVRRPRCAPSRSAARTSRWAAWPRGPG